MRPIIFTIASRNYAAQACVLMESLMVHEPAAERVVIVADGVLESSEVGGARVIPASVLAREEALPLSAMSTYYSALELNTAIKPACFQHLLRHADQVVYLDPDTCLYAPLTSVWDGFEHADLLLTPHLLSPLEEGARPDSTDILRSGIYNLGFLSVCRTAETLDLLHWWRSRCLVDCRVDFARGLFTDQRWMDFAPSFVRQAAILRDQGLNVAYWNVTERLIDRQGPHWTAGGAPLRFFHFSGLDPNRADLLSKHQDRVSIVRGTALAHLVDDYARRLRRAGYARAISRPYGFGAFPDGTMVSASMRSAFLGAAQAGRELGDGLSSSQLDWLKALDPSSIGVDTPRTWSGTEFSQVGHRAGPSNDVSVGLWNGAAREAVTWLQAAPPTVEPLAVALYCRARPDLLAARAQVQGMDAQTRLALCIGVEAAQGRFSVDGLDLRTRVSLFDDGAKVIRQAVQWWKPAQSHNPFVELMLARHSLGPAARWPVDLFAGLDSLIAKEGGLEIGLWKARRDLKAQFDLRLARDRLRLKRWFAVVGVEEYELDQASLPVSYRLMRRLTGFARASIRPARRFGPPVKFLWCSAEGHAPRPGVELWFDIRAATMSNGDRPPRHVDTCIHVGALTSAPLTWMALRRQGIAANHYVLAPVGEGDLAASSDPAWSFIDSVLSPNHGLVAPRPVVESLTGFAHQR